MKIDNDILEVIERSETVGGILFLPPGQLERRLYERVNKALVLCGGKWNRAKRGHVFEITAESAIEQMVLTGTVVGERREFDAFYTPAALAAQVCDLAHIKPHNSVLEPSAGDGAIVREAVSRGARVTVYEVRGGCFEALSAAGADHGMVMDFLTAKPSPVYDAVVMNPPFSKRQDVRHVIHALRFVKPGGRLVAIMSMGIEFRQDPLTISLRQEIMASGGTIERLPEGAFKESGTMVNAAIVSMTRR